MMLDIEWARLEVGRTPWKAIFVEKGYLNKVYTNYTMRGVWDAEVDGFCFQIQLWNRGHQCNLDVIEPKLYQWRKRLKQEGFGCWTMGRANKPLAADIDGYKFSESPTLIIAGSEVQMISKDQIEKMTSHALVDEVFLRVKSHCDIVDQSDLEKLSARFKHTKTSSA